MYASFCIGTESLCHHIWHLVFILFSRFLFLVLYRIGINIIYSIIYIASHVQRFVNIVTENISAFSIWPGLKVLSGCTCIHVVSQCVHLLASQKYIKQ